MDRLKQNLGGRIQPTPLYRKTFSSLLVVTANRTVNVLILWGVEIKKVYNFNEILMTMCHCY